MKLLFVAALLFVGASAQADVVFKRPANDASSCTTPVQKQELRLYISGKKSTKPSCLKLGGIKSTTSAINNCKTAMQKMQFRQYQNGKVMNPPSCYKPATWVGHAKSFASCSFQDRLKVRRIQNGKADVMEKYPACYK
jgi:hypothetical protein